MDYCKFLNSNDIKGYLAKIGYKFTPEEAMYIVHDNRNLPLFVKHSAYKELISQFPAYPLGKRKSGIFDGETLSSFLTEFIKKQNALINEIYDGKGGYSYMYYTERGGWADGDGAYETYEECFNALKRAEKYKIVKKKGNRTLKLRILPDGTVLDVFCWDTFDHRTFELLNAFSYMYADIPSPFVYGDVVVPKLEIPDAKPFVLTKISTWGEEIITRENFADVKMRNYYIKDEEKERRLREGDITDMWYCGRYSDGIETKNACGTYLDLEYYRDK